ncbi:hypothetical protein HDU92_008707 [Lobulomyces angularis]|nr:hypothetical protein HDU92_008707 [Lobulomyces angularis]
MSDLKKKAIYWRKKFDNLNCDDINTEKVHENGGWCLKDDPSSDKAAWMGARPALHHVPVDHGVASTVAKHLTSGNTREISLIDIGAGVGQYGRYFKRNCPTINYKGFDGAGNVEQFTDNFLTWIDVTDPAFDTIGEYTADWIMSLEVGEHIPSSGTDNFISLLDRHSRKGVILSWAVVGQHGHSHINNKDNDEVIKLFKERGYYQDDWTRKFQEEAREKAKYWWFKKTILVFKKN